MGWIRRGDPAYWLLVWALVIASAAIFLLAAALAHALESEVVLLVAGTVLAYSGIPLHVAIVEGTADLREEEERGQARRLRDGLVDFIRSAMSDPAAAIRQLGETQIEILRSLQGLRVVGAADGDAKGDRQNEGVPGSSRV